ncbi:MAG: hypothetical protein U9R54_03790 [Bacteroidota bacterium]|nr:hypothetical protein [Bacteroidota bacterium]
MLFRPNSIINSNTIINLDKANDNHSIINIRQDIRVTSNFYFEEVFSGIEIV